MKKILVINGSPKGAKGNTEVIVSAFVEGMETEGASVKRLYTKDLKINPCCGCFRCWIETPGVCVHKDDMEVVLGEIDKADVLVLASPVYSDGVTGQLKTLLDRYLSRVKPFQVIRDGHCRHEKRVCEGPKQLVLVSNCGFHEMDNFEPLLAQMKARAKNLQCEFAGALLRPHGPILPVILEHYPSNSPERQKANQVLAAAKKAGRELAKDGKMAKKTLRGVSQDLLSVADYSAMVDFHFTVAIEEAAAKAETKALKVAVG